MILRRLGNKSDLAAAIICRFPPHQVYYDLFFGGGGLFFAKPLAPYNWCNDLDGDVVNLFDVLMRRREELDEALRLMPLHEDLFNRWKTKREKDELMQAIRFLFLSNFSLLGKRDTMQLLHSQIAYRQRLVALLEPTQRYLERCMFRCQDFRDFLAGIRYGDEHIPLEKRFIYADPPYFQTTNNYGGDWKKQDTTDLFDVLTGCGMRFALSEYDHPHVLTLAEAHGLHVTHLGERRAMGARRQEILITNYPMRQWRQMEIGQY